MSEAPVLCAAAEGALKTFDALLLEKDAASGLAVPCLTRLHMADLPAGGVTVRVRYSSLNYKDGLCLGPSGGGLVRHYPHVAGIDLAGEVVASEDPRFQPEDLVVLNGWRVGEAHWGGYSQYARVEGDWLVPLVEGISLRQAMVIGTAGVSAMMAVMALEAHGLRREMGEILVTGASGGVGTVAVMLLAKLGYSVAAVSGKPAQEVALRALGAARVIARAELAEASTRPLETEAWGGCVDAVGGAMLARVLGQMRAGSSVAAVGNAGGVAVPANILPFLLRGINLLGINSVHQPAAAREKVWARLAQDLDVTALERAATRIGLRDVPQWGRAILAGEVTGRVVVDLE